MTAGRILVVDATFDYILALQLCDRGRHAISAKHLGLENAADDVLLPSLAGEYNGRDWMLITSDDLMPGEHSGLIASLGHITIATVDGRRPKGMNQEPYKFEVVHRWVHKMQDQVGHTIERYGVGGHNMWVSRNRR